MKFKEAISRPDSNTWKEEIENEYTRMVMKGVSELLDKRIYQRECRS